MNISIFNKRRQKEEGRRQKFTCSEEVFTSTEPNFFLKEKVLDQSSGGQQLWVSQSLRPQKDEVKNLLPSAFCPLPSRAKPDKFLTFIGSRPSNTNHSLYTSI
jgi:hypothetical protein